MACMAARTSFADFIARRIKGSSVSLFRVIKRLQCSQLTWKPSRILLARSRKTRLQPGHLNFTLSSIMIAPNE